MERRTVSSEGTVTVTGFDDVESGFVLEVTARRVPGGVLLDLVPTLSTVTGFVGGKPVLAKRSMDASAVFDSGDWLVLSGLDSLSGSADASGMPGVPWLQSNSVASDRSTLVLAVRAVRVFSSGGRP